MEFLRFVLSFFYLHSFVLTSHPFRKTPSVVSKLTGTPGYNLCDNVTTCSRLRFPTGRRTNLIFQITLQMSHSFPSIWCQERAGMNMQLCAVTGQILWRGVVKNRGSSQGIFCVLHHQFASVTDRVHC